VECAFERPDEFIPERWYSRPELIKDKRAYAPFSIGKFLHIRIRLRVVLIGRLGARQCVGKSLALVELRLIIAVLLKEFDVKFAEGYDSGVMWRDMKDQVTAQPGLVLCEFTPRGGKA
jgi:cytochrome P450